LLINRSYGRSAALGASAVVILVSPQKQFGLKVHYTGISPGSPWRRKTAAVKPPFYVPLPDRVSGTGGRMFKA